MDQDPGSRSPSRTPIIRGPVFGGQVKQTNRQLLKAIESLARVRRLLTSVQLNFGVHQLNVA